MYMPINSREEDFCHGKRLDLISNYIYTSIVGSVQLEDVLLVWRSI